MKYKMPSFPVGGNFEDQESYAAGVRKTVAEMLERESDQFGIVRCGMGGGYVAQSSNQKNGTLWRDIVSTGTELSPSYVGEALECDARLIAAAPDLLAALESLCKEVSDSGRWLPDEFKNSFHQAQRAIAIAKGGAK